VALKLSQNISVVKYNINLLKPKASNVQPCKKLQLNFFNIYTISSLYSNWYNFKSTFTSFHLSYIFLTNNYLSGKKNTSRRVVSSKILNLL